MYTSGEAIKLPLLGITKAGVGSIFVYDDTICLDTTYGGCKCYSNAVSRGAGNNGRRAACTAEVNDNLGDDDGAGMHLSISSDGDKRLMDINSWKSFNAYGRTREWFQFSVEAAELIQTNYVFIRGQMQACQLSNDCVHDGSAKPVPIIV